MGKVIFVAIKGNVGVCLHVKSTGLALDVVYGDASEKHIAMELTWRSLALFAFKQTVEFIYLLLNG